MREDHYATRSVRARDGEELAGLEMLREQLQSEPELVIVFGDAFKGPAVRQLVRFGDSLGIPVKYVCRMCCKWPESGTGSLKGPRNGNPTSDLQMAADRARPYSLRRPLVLAILAIAAGRRRAAGRARVAS